MVFNKSGRCRHAINQNAETEAEEMKAAGNMTTSGRAVVCEASDSIATIIPVKRTILRGMAHSMERKSSLLVPDQQTIQRAYYACAECGANLEQLSKLLPVPRGMINKWMRHDKAFRSAVRLGMDTWNSSRVEKALVKRALGYQYDEVTEQDVELYGKNSLGMKVLVPAHKTTIVHRVLPPDVGALVFYLTNRDPSRWRSTLHSESISTTETSIEHNVTVDLSKLGKKDLEILRNIMCRVDPKGAVAEPPNMGAASGRARQEVLA